MLLSYERLFQVIKLCYFSHFIFSNRTGSPRCAKCTYFYHNLLWQTLALILLNGTAKEKLLYPCAMSEKARKSDLSTWLGREIFSGRKWWQSTLSFVSYGDMQCDMHSMLRGTTNSLCTKWLLRSISSKRKLEFPKSTRMMQVNMFKLGNESEKITMAMASSKIGHLLGCYMKPYSDYEIMKQAIAM